MSECQVCNLRLHVRGMDIESGKSSNIQPVLQHCILPNKVRTHHYSQNRVETQSQAQILALLQHQAELVLQVDNLRVYA